MSCTRFIIIRLHLHFHLHNFEWFLKTRFRSCPPCTKLKIYSTTTTLCNIWSNICIYSNTCKGWSLRIFRFHLHAHSHTVYGNYTKWSGHFRSPKIFKRVCVEHCWNISAHPEGDRSRRKVQQGFAEFVRATFLLSHECFGRVPRDSIKMSRLRSTERVDQIN